MTTQFRFKHFAVSHHRSAMKVGVDGVLIGCWTDPGDALRILDVGTGCGLIALIMAQRSPHARILGIDVDDASIEEARENVSKSPWSDRMVIEKALFPEEVLYAKEMVGFDLIVSNPPYFNSGLTDVSTPRELARHQGVLSPASLLKNSVNLLNDKGSLAMVIPMEEADEIQKTASALGYTLIRLCKVRGHCNAPWKRCLLQWQIGENSDIVPIEEQLTLEVNSGQPTDDYRALCKDFYLKF